MSNNGTRTIRIWGDTLTTGRCRSERCGAAITFARTVKSDAMMPFDGEVVALKTERDLVTGRPVWHVDYEASHFRTCPDADRFSGSGRR